MSWRTIARPGYFGRYRDQLHKSFDSSYGEAGWRLRWKAGLCELDRFQAVLVYEDAYFAYLDGHPSVVQRLIRVAADVYDDDPINTYSGIDYSLQQTARTHLQDIAIRRVLLRLGQVMKGRQLLQIRDADVDPPVHELSLVLSPGRIPFHRPEWIMRPEIAGWWEPGSVESWYQSNKLLQIQNVLSNVSAPH